MGAEDVLSVHSVRKPPRSTLWGAVTACPTMGGRPHTGLLVRASLLASVSRVGVPGHEEPISPWTAEPVFVQAAPARRWRSRPSDWPQSLGW
jgi:hypothetical protein